MTSYLSLHPLKYVAEVLAQMASTLRDFNMNETADLLERAKADIDGKLAEEPQKEKAET